MVSAIDIPRSFLDTKSQFQCLFFCKTWKTAAIEEYYQVIPLKKQSMMNGSNKVAVEGDIIQSILNDQDKMKPLKAYGNRVKRLKVFHNSETTDVSLLEFLRYFPNLLKIDLSQISYQIPRNGSVDQYPCFFVAGLNNIIKNLNRNASNYPFLNYLGEIALPDVFWKELLARSWNANQQYLELCSHFKNSFTHLQLYINKLWEVFSIDGQQQDCFQFLSRFRCLQHLVIRDYPTESEFPNTVSLLQILSACSTARLTSLE